MVLHSVGVGVGVLVAGVFVLARVAAVGLSRNTGVGSRVVQVGRSAWFGFGTLCAVGGVVLWLPGVSVRRVQAALPASVSTTPTAAVLVGLGVGLVATLGLAAFRRGLAPLDRAVVDRSSLSVALRTRRRWWAAHLGVSAGLWPVVVLGVDDVVAFGRFGAVLSVPFFLALLVLLGTRSVPADRLRDPTEAERERIESSVDAGLDGVPDRIVLFGGATADAPVVAVRGRSPSTAFVDESFLEAASDRDLAAALALASRASAGGYRRRLAVGGAFLVDALVLGAAAIASGSVASDPVTLGLLAVAAGATGMVAVRATRRVIFEADRVVADRIGTEAVRAVLERFGSSVPVPAPGAPGRTRYAYHYPTVPQRRTVLERATGDDADPAASPSATRIVAGVLAGWLLFGLAVAIRIGDAPAIGGGGLSATDPVLAVGRGLLVGVIAVGGYALVSGGTPVLWLPLTRRELPLDPRHVRRHWLTVAAAGPAVTVVVLLAADGVVHWGWPFLVIPWVWSLRQLLVHVPVSVPRAWMRAPTASQRAAVEAACAEFDREPGTVVVFQGTGEWGRLVATAAGGAPTLWIHEDLLDSMPDAEVGVALAQAHERARQSWYTRGQLLPIAILLTALVALAAGASSQSPAIVGAATLAAVVAVVLTVLNARRARGIVYRADDFASSVFGAATVGRSYERRGRALRQVWFSLEELGAVRGRVVGVVSGEPSVERRLDRLGDPASQSDA